VEEHVMTKKRKIIEEFSVMTEPVAVEEATSANDLKSNLEETKSYYGVIGYIMRNSTSATIDLKDPTKIVDYAILSSSALDAGNEFSKLFDLGNMEDIIVEGKKVKVLSLAIGENKVSVFMDKNADCAQVLKKLRSL
jgi:predicted regulator of Ras-like GTPase activity (Roadblock/LC7/MglB family)